jgi:hypothetical protein
MSPLAASWRRHCELRMNNEARLRHEWVAAPDFAANSLIIDR